MGDVRQYLVTTSDDGVSVKRVELTVPSGMGVQLVEGMNISNILLTLRLPILYEGSNWQAAINKILANEYVAKKETTGK
jgi:hypothetical protein